MSYFIAIVWYEIITLLLSGKQLKTLKKKYNITKDNTQEELIKKKNCSIQGQCILEQNLEIVYVVNVSTYKWIMF